MLDTGPRQEAGGSFSQSMDIREVGLRVSREFDLRHTIVVTVETVELESGALAVYPMLCRMYVSGDYLERYAIGLFCLYIRSLLPL